MYHDPDDELCVARDRAVDALLGSLPELVPVVAEIEHEYGGPAGAHLVFSELGEIAVRLLLRARDEAEEELLERIFEAVEAVVTTPGADITETVAYGFIGTLDPVAIDEALSYLHRETEQILERYLTYTLDGEPDAVLDDDEAAEGR